MHERNYHSIGCCKETINWGIIHTFKLKETVNLYIEAFDAPLNLYDFLQQLSLNNKYKNFLEQL